MDLLSSAIVSPFHKCLKVSSRRICDLPAIYKQPTGTYGSKMELHPALTIGRDYVVYAVTTLGRLVYYCLCDDDYTGWPPFCFPSWDAAPLFEVVDNTLSRYWRFRHFGSDHSHDVLIAFEPWLSDWYFYDRLTDCDDLEPIEIWRRVKLQMDEEAGFSHQAIDSGS